MAAHQWHPNFWRGDTRDVSTFNTNHNIQLHHLQLQTHCRNFLLLIFHPLTLKPLLNHVIFFFSISSPMTGQRRQNSHYDEELASVTTGPTYRGPSSRLPASYSSYFLHGFQRKAEVLLYLLINSIHVSLLLLKTAHSGACIGHQLAGGGMEMAGGSPCNGLFPWNLPMLAQSLLISFPCAIPLSCATCVSNRGQLAPSDPLSHANRQLEFFFPTEFRRQQTHSSFWLSLCKEKKHPFILLLKLLGEGEDVFFISSESFGDGVAAPGH